ncbi:MAG TPA: molybdopterin cofactor-binding domain-containing protein [Candidatus Acidoferrales bacterium]|nr:molybdopterin cofactor-binding domain-containing protein [Candidatus Acidoferrales bacterium]
MSGEEMKDAVLEFERYELKDAPLHHFALDRRTFMKSIGGGIAILLVAKEAVALQESGRRGFRRPEMPRAIDAWLHVAPDDRITVFTGKVEIGQNIRTSLAQTVADELHVSLDAITMVMGDTQLTPFDMGTFGSMSTPQMGTQLRRVSYAAREVLTDLAAKRWNADSKNLVAENGKISDLAARRTITYGELAKGQLLAQDIPAEDPVTPASEWKIAGQPIHKIGARDFVTGKHKYPADMKLPGMLYGKVIRPAAFGATLESVDFSAAKAIPGVITVRDGDFIGIAAPDEFTAERAAGAVKAQWTTTPQSSSKELFQFLRQNVESDPQEENRFKQAKGDVNSALSSAAHRVDATYTISYIAHCPLEPRAALAEWKDGKLTVWTGTQRPFGVRGELMDAFHLPQEKVRVLMPAMGSAYGGKHSGECAVEAARLAQGAGRPVHLLWTREEEFTWAYFRPAGVIEVKAGASADGTLTAWEFHNYNSGPSAIAPMYEIANQLNEFHPVKAPLRQGSYRSLAACANHFARESHMDDVAHACGMDPLEFRMKNLHHPRLRAVYEAAAKEFDWQGRKKTPGHGFGIAGGIEKGGHIAAFAEVAVNSSTREVRIVRVVQAFDCGAIVNPDGLENTISGAITMGIGGAFYEAIEFDNGRILNPHFAQYRVPRFKDEPVIKVALVDRKDERSFGAGETPIVGISPAVANAIFDATGQRIRSMPMLKNGVLPA